MKIPTSRAIVCDVLRYDRSVPTFAHDRTINVGTLIEARQRVNEQSTRISWPAIWLKAYTLNAKRFPRLQQTWMNWPAPYLYAHPEHVGTLVVKRRFEDDDWLFWAQIYGLESKSLFEIQADIDRFQKAPVEEVFHRQLWFSRQPAILPYALPERHHHQYDRPPGLGQMQPAEQAG